MQIQESHDKIQICKHDVVNDVICYVVVAGLKQSVKNFKRGKDTKTQTMMY